MNEHELNASINAIGMTSGKLKVVRNPWFTGTIQDIYPNKIIIKSQAMITLLLKNKSFKTTEIMYRAFASKAFLFLICYRMRIYWTKPYLQNSQKNPWFRF